MRVAALDLGSNTTLLLVAEVEGGRVVRVYRDEMTVTRMGQGVARDRQFHPDALKRMIACLGDYAEKIKRDGAEKIIAVATSAARDVSNRDALFEIGRKFGMPIQIVNGETEARLTFSGTDPENGSVVIDVGGGSTEIIVDDGSGPRGLSVDVGAVRLTEKFINAHPVPTAQLDQVATFARTAFLAARLPTASARAVAVAGTPTTLVALELGQPFNSDLINDYYLSGERIRYWIERLAALDLEQRGRLPGLEPKRADIIVAGAIILAEAMRALQAEGVSVSTRGVRYGVAKAWKDLWISPK